MTDTLVLGGWPSAGGCISWSLDNLIAVGTKNQVTLLVWLRQPPLLLRH